LLYDTYGFPLDLTELKARERGLTVDVAEFNRLMEAQKARGKAAQKKEIITVEDFNAAGIDAVPRTEFVGYECENLKLSTKVEGFTKPGDKNPSIAVTQTPFYAAMGGQVSDLGTIKFENETYVVKDVSTLLGVYFHHLDRAFAGVRYSPVALYVDEARRARIEAHHSGTHVMNWALRKVLGNTITQKGSYVGPDRLRFDFSHGAAVTPDELKEIERLVNEKVEADVPVSWTERPYTEVKGDPSILQFFGDKYGDTVRVVSIGDFSKELCGGTHVRHSAQVGFYKIISEGAIAAGIRRIEAASGDALVAHVKEHLPKQNEQFAALRQRKPDLAPLPDSPEADTPQGWWKLWETRESVLHRAQADVAQHEKEEAKRMESHYQKEAVAEAEELISESGKSGEVPYIVHLVDYQPAAYLPFLADAIKKHFNGIVLLAAIEEGKVSLLCAVAPDYTKKIQAGKIIQAIAPLIGGKGGGRPELAQGGGTNPGGVTAALEKAEELIGAVV